MPWIADLHIHSHFSMATSKDCNPQNLNRWAGLKGLSLVGTGDFSHPGWRDELRNNLIPAESGFYCLREQPDHEIPKVPNTRFVVTGELSTIYKKNGKVRKVHHLIVLPSLEDADRISAKLEELGMNIRSDGRPILGLDSYRLLELTLQICPEVIFIPAHIWTPHFSVFGSNSGFDDIEECYEDLTKYIFALETGLSSDPAMNWRWSALDCFTLVSNSDAHNPQNLAREANVFHAEFSYQGMKQALQKKEPGLFGGTIEFFPEEGKYHYDGHRNCEVCLKPDDTIAKAGLCPVCGRKVTVGVLHRVAELADRKEGFKLDGSPGYESMVPLREIIGSAIHSGPTSQKVEQLYFKLLKQFGPELVVLRETEIQELVKVGGVLVAEGVRRLRAGEVSIQPGYDGAYGIISVLREDDRQALKGQAALFESKTVAPSKKGLLLGSIIKELSEQVKEMQIESGTRPTSNLSPEQLAIINTHHRISRVIAGPGTGKTHTLIQRIAYLIKEQAVNPADITGVTFTNKAALELKTRLGMLLNGDKRANQVNLGTFHSIGWGILNQNPMKQDFKLLDEFEARDLLEEVLRQNRIPMTAKEASLIISLIKNKYLWEEELAIPPKVAELFQAYQEVLHSYRRWDFDDILIQTLELWEDNPDWLKPVQQQFQYLFVDEFQDLNLLQYKIMKRWARDNRSLTVIGDPNQSIYGFRGASPEFFDKILIDNPEAESLQLTKNYRSQPLIVNAANSLIDAHFRQEVSVPAPGFPKLNWFEALNEKSAARAIANEITALIGSSMLSAHGQGIGRRKANQTDGCYSFNDVAILYRTTKQAEFLEQALTIAGLPYRVVGPTSTLEASTVKELITFLRFLLEPTDLYLFRANLRQPRWGLKTTEIAQLIDWLKEPQAITSEGFLENLLEQNIPQETMVKLRQFQGVVQYYQSQLGRKSQEIIEDWILRMDPVETEELERFKKICENYRSLEELMQFLPLATEMDIFRKGQKTNGTEAITLSTIHAAKGLEYPVVFITGVEEGLIPYGKEPDLDTIAEEQRLFYVGLTRAKQQLYFVNSQLRTRYGDSVPVEISRFMKILPGDLIEKVAPDQRERQDKQLELF